MNQESRPATSQEADRMRLIARLWTQAHPVVSALISSTVIDFHDAEDLLGQVAETVVTKACEYDSQRPFVPWANAVVNVTQKVADWVEDSLTVEATADNFGDPAEGVVKQLKVAYTFDGRENSITVDENQILKIER